MSTSNLNLLLSVPEIQNEIILDRLQSKDHAKHGVGATQIQLKITDSFAVRAISISRSIPKTMTGRGANIMNPGAIPSFGGMLVVLISVPIRNLTLTRNLSGFSK